MITVIRNRLGREWQETPPSRRMALKAAAWGLALVVVWQGLWLPGQQRLEKAGAQLHQERLLAQRLLHLSGTRGPVHQPRLALTVARLGEWAQGSNLLVIDLQSSGQQVAMTVQGAPKTLIGWIQALEQGGAKLHEIRLQAVDDQLQARIGLALDGG